MSRSDDDRLRDVEAACTAIGSYVTRIDFDNEIVFDAIRARLIEIGEAVKDIQPGLLSQESEIPWKEISRMRDQLTHRYFDTTHSIVHATAINDVPKLAAAVHRILQKSSMSR